MSRYSIHFNRRKISIVEEKDNRSILNEDLEAFSEYRSAQNAVQNAIDLIAKDANIVDASGHPDIREMSKRLADRSIGIIMRGEQRELIVAGIHAMVRYGLPVEFPASIEMVIPGSAGIQMKFDSDSQCVYSMFEFDLAMEPMRILLGNKKRWNELLGRIKSGNFADNSDPEKLKFAAKGKTRAQEKDPEKKEEIPKLNIGVLGVTGAGKSTFINSLIGRQLMPVAREICTSVIVEIRHGITEGCRVEWYDQKLYDSILAKIVADVTAFDEADYPTHGMLNKVRQKKEDVKWKKKIRDDVDGFRSNRKPVDLAAIEKYVVEDKFKNHFIPRFIKKVIVEIESPVLQHINLIDTPGLRDPESHKVEATLNAIGRLDAWIYLVESQIKKNTSMADDLRLIVNQANNKHGILILTKIDQLQKESNEASVDLESVMRTKHKSLLEMIPAEYVPSGSQAVYTASKPVSELKTYFLSDWVKFKDTVDDHKLVSFGRAIYGGERRVKTQIESLVETEYVSDALKTGLLDYFCDMFEFPHCAVTVSKVAAEKALAFRIRSGGEELAREVLRCKETIMKDLETYKKFLEDIDALQSRESLILEGQKKVDELKKKRGHLKKQTTNVGRKTEVKCNEHLMTFRGERIIRIEKCLKSLNFSARKQNSGDLWGDMTFGMFESFDSPVALAGSAILQGFESEILSIVKDELEDHKAALFASLKRDLSAPLDGYSLHDGNLREICESEKLFERFSTTLERYEHKVSNACRSSFEQILSNFSDKLTEIRNIALNFCMAQEDEIAETIKNLELDVSNMEELNRSIKKDLPGSKAHMKNMIGEIGKSIDLVDAFAKDFNLDSVLSGDDGPEDVAEDKTENPKKRKSGKAA